MARGEAGLPEVLSADVVVVGAGSAGCVVAARLSEDPSLEVVLLEAGGPDRDPWIHVPAGYFKTIGNPRTDWCHATECEPELAGRRIPWPRGKVLGGSSSLNGMLYLRGHAADYDAWRDAGNAGWGWRDVLPYFERAESNVSVSPIEHDELSDAFLAAMHEAGVGATADFNGGDHEGVGYFRMSTRKGRRHSAARAYLHPARHRRNLRVLDAARALKVRIEDGRATAVEYERAGRPARIAARREVVLSCGTLASPLLLQRSGIGPGPLLQALGIPLVADLRGVGANLQDHLQVRLVYRCARPLTLNDIYHRLPLRLRALWQYAARRRGPLATGIYPAGAFVRVSPEAARPDVQVHFCLVSFARLGGPPDTFSGFTLSACVLRPHSRGSVRITSPHPAVPAELRGGYLTDARDRELLVRAVPYLRSIAAQRALAPYVAEEVRPGPQCSSPEATLEFVRGSALSVHHQVGTCAMGASAEAVVDERLRVRGVRGLRVADGSIMPTLVSGNTNAPILMIGEKAADLIAHDLKAAA